MAKKSAGLPMHRCRHGILKVSLAHPGGPFWQKKDLGSWSIPKGEYTHEEDPLEVAKRRQQEFLEVDRAGWFSIRVAGEKIIKGQPDSLHELVQILRYSFLLEPLTSLKLQIIVYYFRLRHTWA